MLVVDVRESASAEQAVQALLARVGRLDILVANAGAISPFDQSTWTHTLTFFFLSFRFGTETRVGTAMHQKDPDAWWNTFEVNNFRCASESRASSFGDLLRVAPRRPL